MRIEHLEYIKIIPMKANKCLKTGNICSNLSIPSSNEFVTIVTGYHYELKAYACPLICSYSYGAFKTADDALNAAMARLNKLCDRLNISSNGQTI